jgi:hypothetical protein
LRGAETVAVAHLQNFLDVQFADFIKAERTPFFVGGQVTGAMLEIFRQVGNVDEITHGGDAGGGNDIFEFADVAGSGMLEKNGLRAATGGRGIVPERCKGNGENAEDDQGVEQTQEHSQE